MNRPPINVYGRGCIGITGLFVLFWNFGENTFDLYDVLIHTLMR